MSLSLNFDVVNELCYLLRETKNYKSLVSLALTCKDFSEPALDAIWHSIPHIAPLLQVIQVVKHRSAERSAMSMYMLEANLRVTRSPTAKDWERVLRYYAPRVQVVSMQHLLFEEDKDEKALLDCLPDPYILPNAHSLTFRVATNSPFRTFQAMIHPKLNGLHMTFDTNYSPEGPIFQHIKDTCDLTMLSLDHDPWSSPRFSHETVISVIMSMRKLRRVKSRIPTAKLIPILAQLPKLDTMDLELYEAVPIEAIATMTKESFNNLRHLQLSSVDVSFCMPPLIVFRSSSHCLTSLSLRLLHILPNSEWERAIMAVASIASLTFVTLRDIRSGRRALSIHNFDPSETLLEPLYALKGLKKLHVLFNHRLSVKDHVLRTMAKSWPLIEELDFNTQFLCSSNVPSVFELRSLAVHCQYLTSFSCKINAVYDVEDIPQPPAGEPLDSEIKAHEKLITFRFHASPISNPPLVARFLNRYFRRCNVNAFIGPSLREDEGWKSVAELCKEFHGEL